jgi:hypothetical protein
MKKVIVLLTLFIGFNFALAAQKSAGVITIDAQNIDMDPVTLGNILRNEIVKLDLFKVIDPYETMEACQRLDVEPEDCQGQTCLTNVGLELQVDKMLGGSIDRYSGKLIISIRSIDVSSGIVDQNYIAEFIDVQENIPVMINLALRKMYQLKVDADMWSKLTNANDFENTINTPDVSRLKLNGPRFGVTFVAGTDGETLQKKKSEGGFDVYPMMSQFGYQFEVSYLNQGNVQALFEFVPSISGLEQGLFIPSVSILHGIRSNKSGLEFIFGPVFILSKKARGFEQDGQWYLEDDRSLFPQEELDFERRLDSRGIIWLDSGLVIAFGKTFKSGKVNFPVNLVGVLKKSGARIGLSFGFNASERLKK